MSWTDEERGLLTRLGFTQSDMNAARYARMGVPNQCDAFFTHTVTGYQIRVWPMGGMRLEKSKVSDFKNIGAIPLLVWAVTEGML